MDTKGKFSQFFPTGSQESTGRKFESCIRSRMPEALRVKILGAFLFPDQSFPQFFKLK